MIHGTLTAMITPFKGGEIDYDRLTANIRLQVEAGIDGLVPMGTTGESPTLDHADHGRVIRHVVETVNTLKVEGGSDVTVVAGTGSNSTAEALGLTRHAKEVGADAALMVNPYYNKPTQEGLYRHFMTVADDIDMSIVLYNIPGRTGITMAPDTVARLAAHPHIIAVKEATGSMDIASQIAALCDPDKFTILSGDDSLTLPLMSIGAKGVISVLSNLIPARVKALVTAAAAGNFTQARKLHLELFPLFNGMFIETNPIPIKTAMALCGLDSGELRLPLCEMASGNQKRVEDLLRTHSLLKK